LRPYLAFHVSVNGRYPDPRGGHTPTPYNSAANTDEP